ncbi:Uroporphyrinogen decarboxylase [Seminavis robusta]|uniref:Uroporphyrinogen decarboxylase n=1 Tax=Seminavis robusta TaxID=568900 RepID=A0A9N8DWM2_9STRA|nr:Uroporphyrinogen decarboxylase [Seminavis robusta]|eukprot:Sro350_g123690.1 Uroporphyrinogen decarboxylase (414) ;mRNA; f:21840-23081
MKFTAASLVFLQLLLNNGSHAFSVNQYTPTDAAMTRMSATVEAAADEKVTEHNHCQEPGDRDILVRAARGETVERTPVWMMRQAGRYMAAFRAYSTKYEFRQRSETPAMATELSLQCHRKYGMDGIIMFSDILTPLPTLGIDFDVVRGTGPVISTEIRTEEDVDALATATKDSFDEKLPFIREILGELSKEAQEMNTSLIGFVGAPFTLASYTIEGKSSKNCLETKKMLMSDDRGDDKAVSKFLDKLANMIGMYACHQIECGAQVIQVFESWAHQLNPDLFEQFAKPAAQKAIQIIKEQHPDVPVIYFANGGSSYLEKQRDMGADMIAVDWAVDMAEARKILGPDVAISGNIDPTILFGSKEQIEQAVRDCIDRAGGPGKHLLNLGHGVMQGTPEEAVGWLVDECKRYKGKDA